MRRWCRGGRGNMGHRGVGQTRGGTTSGRTIVLWKSLTLAVSAHGIAFDWARKREIASDGDCTSGSLLGFDLGDFLDTARMPAAALERCLEPDADHLHHLILADKIRRKTQHIRVIVAATHFGR